MRHLAQHRQGEVAHHSQLEDEAGVEGGVGVLLVGEDPLLLAAPHRRPAADGVQRRRVPVLVIAHYAAQQAVVGGGNPVVVVDAERCQRRDIYLEELLLRQAGGQLGVEAVDALNQQHLAGIEAHGLTLVDSPTQLEAVGWQVHLLATEQSGEVRLQPLKVQGVQALVVQLPVGVARGALAVHEVIVEGNHLGGEHIGHELDAQALGRGGLARRRRAGQQHYAGAALGDAVGDAPQELAVQGLGHIDEHGGAPLLHGPVELAHVAHADDAVEAQVLGEGHVHLALLLRLGRTRRVLGIRAQQQHSLLVGHEVEDAQVTGGRHQRAGEGIIHPIEGVEHGVESVQGLHEAQLVGHVLAAETLPDIVRQAFAAPQGQVFSHQSVHGVAQPVHQRDRRRHGTTVGVHQPAVETPRYAVFHLQPRLRGDHLDGLV